LDKVDIGVIGAGSWSNLVHYPSLAELPDVNIVAVCDHHLEGDKPVRLNKTANKYGVKNRFTDYKVMLDEVDLDAVYVILASHLVLPPVLYCLKKKKHVFIEKPPGNSLEQTKKMAEAAEENRCLTMCGFNRRFIPVAMEAKRIVEENGPITQCLVTYHKYIPPESRISTLPPHTEPTYSPEEPGEIGPYMEDVCHAVDLLRWACGDVKEVSSCVSKHYSKEINAYNALVVFESNAIGILNTNRASGARIHSVELHSRDTWCFIDLCQDLDKLTAVIVKESGYFPHARPQIVRSKYLPGLSSVGGYPPFYKYYGYFDENRHFVQCVKEKTQPQTSFKDAVKTMELIMKIQSGPETPPIT